MKISFGKFTVKDVAFLAVMAALLVLSSATAMPVMGAGAELFGIENMCTALFYGAFSVIALAKVRKPGALTLLSLFSGSILLLMSPVMFFIRAGSGLVSEALVLLSFRSYRQEKAVLAASALQAPLSLPFNVLLKLLLRGDRLENVIRFSGRVGLIAAGTVVLSIAGALLGMKIVGELRKAGKLR